MLNKNDFARYTPLRSLGLGMTAHGVSTTLGQALGYNPFLSLSENWYAFRDGVLLANTKALSDSV